MILDIRMEVDVNTAAWLAEYGSPGSANDVEDYLLNHINNSAAALAGAYTLTAYAVQER